MPTTMSPQKPSRTNLIGKTPAQKVCIVLGVAFIVVGLIGVTIPGLMGMHLSMLHNMIHLFSGLVALGFGMSSANRAFNYCVIFGTVYALIGMSGFLLGQPGYPSFGNMESDQNLLKIIPGYLEFGTMDHLVHFLIGAFLVFTAFTFRKEKDVNP